MNESENPIRTGPWQPAQSEPPAPAVVAVETPAQIGRYRVKKILGEGGYGRVYLAHDDKLNRPVAIKMPHRKLVARPEDVEAYLTEAQNVAISIIPISSRFMMSAAPTTAPVSSCRSSSRAPPWRKRSGTTGPRSGKRRN